MLATVHFSFGQASAPDSSEVIRQLRAGENEPAIKLANKLLAQHPKDCKVLSLKAVALQNLNRATDSLATFEKAIVACPTYLPALEGAAQLEYAQESPDTLSTLTKVLALVPGDITANAMMAVTLQRDSRCPEALPHFEASQPLFAKRPDLLQGSASCLAQTGDYKDALAQYLDLLNAQPSDSIRYDVAVLQWKTGAKEDALATLAPLLTAGTFEPAFSLASRIAEEMGDTPRAVDLLRMAIQLAPDRIDNYIDFSTLAFNHKSFQVGVDMIDAGLQRSPNAAQLYLARGVLEVQLTKSDAAVADFEQAHRLDPKLSFAVDAMGMMSSQAHDDAASLALFEAQAKNHPDDPLLHYLLAEQLAQAATENDSATLRAAIAAASRAAALEPNYQPSHDLLATLYLRAKQPELAIKEAELALSINPNDDSALYQELMAKRRAGKTAEIESLTARLKTMREQNAKAVVKTDRYRLQDNVTP